METKDTKCSVHRRVLNAKRFEAYICVKNATLNRENTKGEEIIITLQMPSSKNQRELYLDANA